ncbi:MAG: D-alanine--D-alanine ligase family protein [Clostridia bacterium]|nr:D-alanine--D-alanine ligase family protein [Clostridia bacterium]
MSKIQLGVIFGSRSCEREVAIISAVQLMNNVDTEKYDIIPVYIDELGHWYTGEALRRVDTFVSFNPDAKGVQQVSLDLSAGSGALLAVKPGSGLFGKPEQVLAARLEVCVIVMHGLNGEDGTLQGLLEMANLPYTSTGVAGSAIGMDKIMMKQFFKGAGLPVLPGVWHTRTQWEQNPDAVMDDCETLGYPVFVKPANLGSSIGVSRADDREGLADSLSLAFEYDRRVLIEKGLDRPVELNCSVLGYDEDVTASPIEMPVSAVGDDAEFLDFRKKYLENSGTKGMASLSRLLPAPIEDDLKEKIQQLSCDIFRMMDCKGVVRIDYMFDKASNGVYITEINTIPGSLSFYLWENAGMSYAKLIDRMVDCAIRAHEDRNARSYAFTSDILQSVNLGGGKGAKGAKGAKGGAGCKGAKA